MIILPTKKLLVILGWEFWTLPLEDIGWYFHVSWLYYGVKNNIDIPHTVEICCFGILVFVDPCTWFCHLSSLVILCTAEFHVNEKSKFDHNSLIKARRGLLRSFLHFQYFWYFWSYNRICSIIFFNLNRFTTRGEAFSE